MQNSPYGRLGLLHLLPMPGLGGVAPDMKLMQTPNGSTSRGQMRPSGCRSIPPQPVLLAGRQHRLSVCRCLDMSDNAIVNHAKDQCVVANSILGGKHPFQDLLSMDHSCYEHQGLYRVTSIQGAFLTISTT